LNNIEEVLCSLYEEKISKISPEENSQIKNVMVRYSISYHKDFHKIRRYNDYTEMLVKEMIRLREEGVIYKDIALYLSNKGYKSSRGKQLTGKLVERMIEKRKISEERGRIQKVEYGDIDIEFMKK
jgi:predicted double-glycine peptidase